MVQVNTLHRNGGRQMEDGVIQSCAVLPLGKQSVPEERPELRVAQPDSGQVRGGTAGTGCKFDTDDSVFTAVTLRTFHAQFVKGFEVVLVDGRNNGAFFCRLDECPEGLELISLRV